LIRDDGIGGANSCNGSGLTGLKDRVEALGGRLHIDSAPGSGTSLSIAIPWTTNERREAVRLRVIFLYSNDLSAALRMDLGTEQFDRL
jgi:signal transduction histidine kinase